MHAHIGKYEIKKLLGKGATGSVYLRSAAPTQVFPERGLAGRQAAPSAHRQHLRRRGGEKGRQGSPLPGDGAGRGHFAAAALRAFGPAAGIAQLARSASRATLASRPGTTLPRRSSRCCRKKTPPCRASRTPRSSSPCAGSPSSGASPTPKSGRWCARAAAARSPPRSATVTAMETSWVLGLRIQDIDGFSDSCRARFSEVFLSVMAERLSMLGGRLVSLRQEKNVGMV